MDRRVAITGIGAVSPVGMTVGELWDSCLHGRSGIRRISSMDPAPFSTQIAGEVRDFAPEQYLDPKLVARLDRFCQMGLVAAHLALEDAGFGGLRPLPDGLRERAAVIFGSGIGGMQTFEEQHQLLLERGPRRVSPFFVPMLICDMAAGMIAIHTGAMGPNFCVVTACATAAHNIGEAAQKIRTGAADMAIAGGAEAAIIPTAIAGFSSAKALSRRNDEPERACRPFDRDRDGFVIAEGAAAVVLEEMKAARARGARIYAELAGYGASGDAYHMTAPRPDGHGAVLAMRWALEDAGIEPSDVDYVNAHAPGTQDGDAAEAVALETLFGDSAGNVSVSSTKPIHGHQLGAVGGTELIVCLLAMRDGIVPHTLNCDNPEREYAFDLVRGQPKRRSVRIAMSNSFGFGGHNAVLVVKAVD
ncbi:MAG: beta-ketoacyl-ACP synthase II [Armatimonadetes bacterium]|nr:beta-ketoacyl-ACP synthase II [Armatimonadota bacterium]